MRTTLPARFGNAQLKEALINPSDGAGGVKKGLKCSFTTCELRFFDPFSLAIIRSMNKSEVP